jgi:hypothetical protein
MASVGQTAAQSPHCVQTLTLYTPGTGNRGSMIKAAFLGLFSLNKLSEQATLQALHPEHLAGSTYNRIFFSFDVFLLYSLLVISNKGSDIFPHFHCLLSLFSSVYRLIIYNMPMKDVILSRLGSFFILVGFLFLIIFIGSILGGDITIKYLGLCSASFFLGYVILRAKKKPEPTRFSSIRKIHQAVRSNKDEKHISKDNQEDQTNTSFPGDK